MLLGYSWASIKQNLRISSEDGLSTALTVAGTLGVSEKLDRVFGLLGLTVRYGSMVRWPRGFRVDYHQSSRKVFSLATKAAVAQSGQLELLAWANAEMPHSSENLNLPSWVPFWFEAQADPLDDVEHFGYEWLADGDHRMSVDSVLDHEHYDVLPVEGTTLDVIDCATAPFTTIKALKRYFDEGKQLIERRCCARDMPDIERLVHTMMGGGRSTRALRALPLELDGEFYRGLESFLRSTNLSMGDVEALKLAEGSFNRFAANSSLFCKNRRLFVTSQGHFGLAPKAARPGDVISLLIGSSVPLVLRPIVDDTHRPSDRNFSLLGECYIHGEVMTGDYMIKNMIDGLPLSKYNLI